MNPMSEPKFALITGASGGIGLEMAKEFAKHGHPLILVARSREKLQQLQAEIEKTYGVKTEILAKDLSQSSSAPELYEEVLRKGWTVETLVNNAGFGLYGAFSEEDLNQEVEMIRLNVLTLTQLTKLFLKGMLERKNGRILNVASTAAFQPGPMMAVYYATKSYVLHFSEAIHEELKGSGVSVSCLCPGPTESDFQKRASINMKIPLFKAARIMSASAVARAGYQGMMKNKAVILPGLVNQLTPWGMRLLPRGWVTAIVQKLQKATKSHEAKP
jgi:short-subunit dehydrogenase